MELPEQLQRAVAYETERGRWMSEAQRVLWAIPRVKRMAIAVGEVLEESGVDPLRDIRVSGLLRLGNQGQAFVDAVSGCAMLDHEEWQAIAPDADWARRLREMTHTVYGGVFFGWFSIYEGALTDLAEWSGVKVVKANGHPVSVVSLTEALLAKVKMGKRRRKLVTDHLRLNATWRNMIHNHWIHNPRAAKATQMAVLGWDYLFEPGRAVAVRPTTASDRVGPSIAHQYRRAATNLYRIVRQKAVLEFQGEITDSHCEDK